MEHTYAPYETDIQQLFGARHVLKTEANSRKADIAYMLTQETLTCKI